MTYIQLYKWIIVNGEPQVLSEMADVIHKNAVFHDMGRTNKQKMCAKLQYYA